MSMRGISFADVVILVNPPAHAQEVVDDLPVTYCRRHFCLKLQLGPTERFAEVRTWSYH